MRGGRSFLRPLRRRAAGSLVAALLIVPPAAAAPGGERILARLAEPDLPERILAMVAAIGFDDLVGPDLTPIAPLGPPRRPERLAPSDKERGQGLLGRLRIAMDGTGARVAVEFLVLEPVRPEPRRWQSWGITPEIGGGRIIEYTNSFGGPLGRQPYACWHAHRERGVPRALSCVVRREAGPVVAVAWTSGRAMPDDATLDPLRRQMAELAYAAAETADALLAAEADPIARELLAPAFATRLAEALDADRRQLEARGRSLEGFDRVRPPARLLPRSEAERSAGLIARIRLPLGDPPGPENRYFARDVEFLVRARPPAPDAARPPVSWPPIGPDLSGNPTRSRALVRRTPDGREHRVTCLAYESTMLAPGAVRCAHAGRALRVGIETALWSQHLFALDTPVDPAVEPAAHVTLRAQLLVAALEAELAARPTGPPAGDPRSPPQDDWAKALDELWGGGPLGRLAGSVAYATTLTRGGRSAQLRIEVTQGFEFEDGDTVLRVRARTVTRGADERDAAREKVSRREFRIPLAHVSTSRATLDSGFGFPIHGVQLVCARDAKGVPQRCIRTLRDGGSFEEARALIVSEPDRVEPLETELARRIATARAAPSAAR
jgi:hypothetical protein